MAQVIFTFNGVENYIQCNIQDTMREICKKFETKLKLDISKLFFLYGWKEIDKDLTFQQLASKDDENSKLMKVLVYGNPQPDDIKEVKSKEIICPECNENIFINIMDYKINLVNCKQGHNKNNISFEDFEKTQKINISKIICDSCKLTNKGLTHNNEFFKCNTCSQNICPLCKKVKHDETHIIVDYSLKDY